MTCFTGGDIDRAVGCLTHRHALLLKTAFALHTQIFSVFKQIFFFTSTKWKSLDLSHGIVDCNITHYKYPVSGIQCKHSVSDSVCCGWSVFSACALILGRVATQIRKVKNL